MIDHQKDVSKPWETLVEPTPQCFDHPEFTLQDNASNMATISGVASISNI
jgi:hypothetical protein